MALLTLVRVAQDQETPAVSLVALDPAAIGLGFEVLVQVTMDREDAATVADFERGLAQIPEVRHAERLFGGRSAMMGPYIPLPRRCHDRR